MRNIGVLGSAVVGKTLARGFKTHGYEVRIGSGTPEKLAAFSASEDIPAGTFADVSRWAELIVLAVRGSAAENVLRTAGVAAIAGKIIIDTTNPISDAPPVDGVLQFFTGPNTSLMEQLQAAFPDCRMVKAFNTVGNARMINPKYEQGRPTMFFCGNDEEAKATVSDILTQFGWDAADMGSAVAARAIEPLCQLWCIPGFRQGQWTHAFALLRS